MNSTTNTTKQEPKIPSVGQINAARRAAKRSGRGYHHVLDMVEARKRAGLPLYNPGTHADRKRPVHLRLGYVPPITVEEVVAKAFPDEQHPSDAVLDAPAKKAKKAPKVSAKKVHPKLKAAHEAEEQRLATGAPVGAAKPAAIKVTKKVRATSKYAGVKSKVSE